MIDSDPVQSFDLPEECELDHVAIYPNDTPEEPDFYAVPFIHEGSDSDGWDHYREPTDFEVTDRYREAVSERADVSLEEIKLTREIPTTTLGEPL